MHVTSRGVLGLQSKTDYPVTYPRTKAGEFILKKISPKIKNLLEKVFEELENVLDVS